VDILHPSRPNVSRAELSEKLAAIYKTDKNRVVAFGLRTQFGGGRSTGFALIYDDEAAQKKFEPKYRLVRVRCLSSSLLSVLSPEVQSGLAKKVEKPSRKLRKERKNRAKKVMRSSNASSLVTYNDPLFLSSAVPKRSRLQSPPRRASKRWLRSSHLPYMHHVRLAQQNIIGIYLTLCLHFEAKNVKILNCSEGNMWVSKNDCEAKVHIQKPDFL
jgi:ribosomal protein S24E